MQISFVIDDKLFQQLKKDLNVSSDYELISYAFSILKWVSDERKQNRDIISISLNGNINDNAVKKLKFKI
jgi:hypothetical protein